MAFRRRPACGHRGRRQAHHADPRAPDHRPRSPARRISAVRWTVAG